MAARSVPRTCLAGGPLRITVDPGGYGRAEKQPTPAASAGGLAVGKPVILVLQRDELDVLLGALQRIAHQRALLEWDYRIVTAVNQQNRHVHDINVFDGRDGIKQRIRCAAHSHEASPVALLEIVSVDALIVDPLLEALQICNACHGHDASIYARIQRRTRERRVAAVTCADDADARRIDDSLVRKIAHTIRKVGLHLAAPLSKTRRKKALTQIRAAIVGLQYGVTLIGQSLRPPAKRAGVVPC